MTQIESGIIDAGCAQMAATPVCVCVRVCYRLRDARVSELLPPCRTLASVTPLPRGGKNSLGTKPQHKEKQTKKKTAHRLYNCNLYTRKVTQRHRPILVSSRRTPARSTTGNHHEPPTPNQLAWKSEPEPTLHMQLAATAALVAVPLGYKAKL